jgi:hypothetical protein
MLYEHYLRQAAAVDGLGPHLYNGTSNYRISRHLYGTKTRLKRDCFATRFVSRMRTGIENLSVRDGSFPKVNTPSYLRLVS